MGAANQLIVLGGKNGTLLVTGKMPAFYTPGSDPNLHFYKLCRCKGLCCCKRLCSRAVQAIQKGRPTTLSTITIIYIIVLVNYLKKVDNHNNLP